MASLSAKTRKNLKDLNIRRVPYSTSCFVFYTGLASIVALFFFVFMNNNIQTTVFLFLEKILPTVPPTTTLLIIAGILCILLLIPYIKFSRTYRDFFNNQFLPALAEEFGDFKYKKQGIDQQEFEKSNIFDTYRIDRYESMQGFFSQKEQAKIAWVKTAVQKGGYKLPRSYRTLFKGWFLQITLPKTLPSFFILPQKTLLSYIKKFTFTNVIKRPSSTPVKVAGPNFEKNFSFYGNPSSGVLDITASITEKYKHIKKPIFLSVVENKLYLAVQQQDRLPLPKSNRETSPPVERKTEFLYNMVQKTMLCSSR